MDYKTRIIIESGKRGGKLKQYIADLLIHNKDRIAELILEHSVLEIY